MAMPAPFKEVTLEIPANLWQPLRREARRVDRRPVDLILQHVMAWLLSLPDRDAPREGKTLPFPDEGDPAPVVPPDCSGRPTPARS